MATKVREWLIHQTPEPFTRRNIFCGDRMFANKYELAEQHAQWRKLHTFQSHAQ